MRREAWRRLEAEEEAAEDVDEAAERPPGLLLAERSRAASEARGATDLH